MAKPTSRERFNDLGSRGLFGKRYKYGDRLYGDNFYGVKEALVNNKKDTPIERFGIYQARINPKRKMTARLNYYTPYNPRTVPQQDNRNLFAEAMSEWALLTQEQKSVYNVRAKKLRLFGHNLFVKEYINSQ